MKFIISEQSDDPFFYGFRLKGIRTTGSAKGII